jgi:flagellar protein FliS
MAYERAVQSYRKTKVETADQIQLIVMCYEETVQAIRQAKISYEQWDFESKAKHLAKAQSIINELYSSLNREKGGTIAANLATIYSYALNRLVTADIEKDMNGFDEVAALLADLLVGWQEIATDKKAKDKLPKSVEATAAASRGIAV